MSLETALGRAARDGSPTVKVSFYPTEIEIAKLRAISRSRSQFDSQCITGLIEEAKVGMCWYTVKLIGKDAERVEYFARAGGYQNGEAWLQATIDAALRNFKGERPLLASERVTEREKK